jgi:FtsH-binding integral membrane protein
MLDVDYLGGIVGSSLGVLGGITGVLGALAKMNPEKFLAPLKMMVWFDIAVGFLLAGSGILIWFGSSTNYGYDLAETLFFSGAATVGVIGAAASEIVAETRKFIHALLVSGSIFLALRGYSHFTQAALARKSHELTWGVTLLIFYVIALLLRKVISRHRAESVS